MGYRGKVVAREEACRMRAHGLTMPEIATALGVSRSSVSLWTRDIEVIAGPRRRPVRTGPNSLQRRKAASRLRVHLYLHDGLDLDRAINHWVDVTGIASDQFIKPYRAVADPSIRKAKHEMGCASVYYGCSRTHRAIMGLTSALLSSPPGIPG
ncbi:MAG: hypothetical protein NVS3B21_17690 [Acidimicrobiales bacterium]